MKDTLSTSNAAHMISSVYDGTSFTFAAGYALAEYYETLEDETGTEIECDPIAFACEWSEWGTLEEWAADYGDDTLTECLADCDDDEKDETIADFIRDRGDLIEFDGGYLINSF